MIRSMPPPCPPAHLLARSSYPAEPPPTTAQTTRQYTRLSYACQRRFFRAGLAQMPDLNKHGEHLAGHDVRASHVEVDAVLLAHQHRLAVGVADKVGVAAMVGDRPQDVQIRGARHVGGGPLQRDVD